MNFPNLSKPTDALIGYFVLTQGIEIGAGWSMTFETLTMEFMSLALAAPEFDASKHEQLCDAPLNDDSLNAVIWNPTN